jgi:HlyD family secretion protein
VKKRLARSALVVVLVGVAALVFWLATRPQPAPVALAAVERGVVEETVANTRAGTVKACRRARLAPATGGAVARLPVAVGDRVRRGDLLLQVWNEDLAAQLDLAESQVKAAGARAEEACLLADQAAREQARLSRLADEGVAGVQAAEQATSAAEAQRAACRAARAAEVQAQAQRQVVRAELKRTELRAPFDGVVAELTAEEGEVVIPSPPGIPTPPAIDLIEQGCLYVVAPFDEVDAPRVRVGQAARVTLDALPGRSFPARVRRVAPYVLDREKQSRTVDVEVEIEDLSAAPSLAPGYSADVEVLLAAKDGVLRAPTEAVQEGGRVLVLEQGRLAVRTIATGISNWKWTEVTSGLVAGERIVVSLDREGVKPGVRAQPEDAANSSR